MKDYSKPLETDTRTRCVASGDVTFPWKPSRAWDCFQYVTTYPLEILEIEHRVVHTRYAAHCCTVWRNDDARGPLCIQSSVWIRPGNRLGRMGLSTTTTGQASRAGVCWRMEWNSNCHSGRHSLYCKHSCWCDMELTRWRRADSIHCGFVHANNCHRQVGDIIATLIKLTTLVLLALLAVISGIDSKPR